MSIKPETSITLDQFIIYLKELIKHIDEIPYNMENIIMIGTMQLRYDGIYYKNKIELLGETSYIDIINSKTKRLEWKKDSAEYDKLRRERNETLLEQNDFIVKMYISKKRLGYQGELILDMQVPSNPFKHIKLYCPIKDNIQIDEEKRQLEIPVKVQFEEEDVLGKPFEYMLYMNWNGPFKKIMILEKEDCLINYSIEDIILKDNAFQMDILLGEKKTITQINNERIGVLTELRKMNRGKKPQETDAMKRQRRKSVTELIQLSGIKKIMEEGMKNINMCQTDGHVQINIPLEQENHTGNEVPTRGLAGIARLMKQGIKPAKEEKSMEIESNEKPVQTVQSVSQPIQVQPTIQNMINPVVQTMRRQPRTQNVQNLPVQHLPMRNIPPVIIPRRNGVIIPQNFPPNMVNSNSIQNVQYNPNMINQNIPMVNPNTSYMINPMNRTNMINPVVRTNGPYGYPTKHGFRMEQQLKQDDDIMITRGGITMPYNPVITIEETEQFQPIKTDIRQTDREVERKRMIFDEIMQHIKNMKEGRGEKKTYTIYLKNIKSIFDKENDSIKLILKPQSIEFKKRDMYEKGVGHQESITSKKLNIQIESNGFYEENKFKFGMYKIDDKIEILLMIYSDGEVLTYKVNDIQVNEQSIN